VYDALVDDPQRATSAPAMTTESARKLLQGLRIGRIAPHELKVLQTDIVKAYETTLEFFKSAGAHITTLELPCAIADLAPMAVNIMVTEGAATDHRSASDRSQPICPTCAFHKNLECAGYVRRICARWIRCAEFAYWFSNGCGWRSGCIFD
jgi:Asp-tRNA(Asn)/Glu-tRNA(Gln) amidotransferase A subunit family amidase